MATLTIQKSGIEQMSGRAGEGGAGTSGPSLQQPSVRVLKRNGKLYLDVNLAGKRPSTMYTYTHTYVGVHMSCRVLVVLRTRALQTTTRAPAEFRWKFRLF